MFTFIGLQGVSADVFNVWSSWDEDMADLTMDLWISKALMNYLDKSKAGSYLNRLYDNNFSANPFLDILQEQQNTKLDIHLAGMDWISSELSKKSCYLTNESLTSILLSFSEDFSRDITFQIWQNSKNIVNLVPDIKSTENACWSFVSCYYPEFKWSYMSKCKDDMIGRYNQGSKQKTRLQNVKTAQVGEDKFWNRNPNNTEDDSPFDILYDINSIAKVLFEDVKESYVIAFYQMPKFTNSNQNNWGIRGDSQWAIAWTSRPSDANDNAATEGTPINTNSTNLDANNTSEDNEFSTFISKTEDKNQNSNTVWTSTSAWNSSSNSSTFWTNMCNTAEEPEISNNSNNSSSSTSNSSQESISLDNITQAEYEQYINDVKDILSEDAKVWAEAAKQRTDWSKTNTEDPADQEAIKEARTCYSRCEGLRIDQKAVCTVMCTCDTYKSPIRDPIKDWLWPILQIKYCAVPTQNHFFDSDGIIIYSFERVINEIFGVLDSLDKSWELGIYEKQKEMLDSSTKSMNIAKQFTFTVEQTVRSIVTTQEESDKMKIDKAKIENTSLKRATWILKDIQDTSISTKYTIIQDNKAISEENNVIAKLLNALEEQKNEVLSAQLQSSFDQWDISKAEKKIWLWIIMDNFLLRHIKFWVNITDYFKELQTTAEYLISKI